MDAVKKAVLSLPSAGAGRGDVASCVDHVMVPLGDSAITKPALLPVMMLPSPMIIGEVDELPGVGASQKRDPLRENAATPRDVPTTKPVPFGNIAGVEFVAIPAAPPL